MSAPTLTPAEFRRVLGQFSTGVTVVTVESSGEDGASAVHGMTANSFTSVSLDPLLVLICVDQRARTLPLLHQKRRFGVSILAAEQQELSVYFSRGEQNDEGEKRLGIRFRRSASGIPLVEGTLAQMACNVAATYTAGDHVIFIGEVESAEIQSGEPLLFFSGKYRKLAPSA
ncbi:MAG: flavin reductase family protein [Acidobacteriia bacterium]|nr:flavin reductase family protein [Terriglobia bacterium]